MAVFRLCGRISHFVMLTLLLLFSGILPSVAQGFVRTSGAPVIRHDVAVTTVDPAAQQPANKVTGLVDDDLALVNAAANQRKGRLFLFIDGTETSPTMTTDIAFFGAARGYNVISIAYPNNEAIAKICNGSSDDACSGDVRAEVLTGIDHSPLVSVSQADAIEPRVVKLLTYLRTTYPAEGWGEFLDGQTLDWSLVSVAGHSQGAGYAAMIAKRHKVFRMLMISGVADVTAAGATAPWLLQPGETPADREYGLTNVFDPVVRLKVAKASWEAMGLGEFGPMRSVDRLSPPYRGSHELVSAERTGFGVKIHLSMALDRFLPHASDGSPTYTPAWAFTVLP